MWLLPQEKSTPKASRMSHSKGKFSLSQRSPDLFEGEPVADCYNQSSTEEFVSGDDSAMEKTAEKLSAVVENGAYDLTKQKTEPTSRRRNIVPMIANKSHVTVSEFVLKQADDSSHERGGTQKFLSMFTQHETGRYTE
jgi:hypothetical protein